MPERGRRLGSCERLGYHACSTLDEELAGPGEIDDSCARKERGMRILVVNNFFAPRITGSAHFSEDMARQYAREGHEVVVLATEHGGAPRDEVIDGYRVVRVPAISIQPGAISFNYSIPFAFGQPLNLLRIQKLFDEFRPDVVHQNGQFFDLTFITTQLAVRRNVPRVLTVHTALTHVEDGYLRIIRTIDRSIVRFLNQRGGPVWVAGDKRVYEYVCETYRPDEAHRRVIPVSLEGARFVGGDRERIRAQLGLGDRPVILSFGHVIPLRNRLPLIAALPAIRKQYPGVQVMIVGHVYTTEFQELADKLGVSDSLVVVGAVPHDEVRHYIAAADIEGHDLQGSGLGITTLEVMAAGVPVFAFIPRDNYPGIDLGRWPNLMITPDNSPERIAEVVCKLLGDRELRARVADDQRRFVDELFSLPAVAGRYLELFDQLTAQARR
jgi:glycosyltransferase involved in cell wall biosynthesis